VYYAFSRTTILFFFFDYPEQRIRYESHLGYHSMKDTGRSLDHHLREHSFALLLNWAGWETKEDCLQHYRRTHPKVLTDFDLFFVEEGKGDILVDDTAFRLTQGDMFVCYPGEKMDVRFYQSPFTRYFIHFTVLEQHAGNTTERFESLFPRRMEAQDFNAVQSLCSRILHEWIIAEPFWRQNGGAYLTRLFVSLYRDYRHIQDVKSVPHLRKNLHKIQRVRQLIEDNIEEKVDLEKVAQTVQMSKDYFSRIFQKCIGETPHNYLIKCRIHSAQNLLMKSNLPIKRIAAITGFTDQPQFTKTFKKLTGTTPAHYRSG